MADSGSSRRPEEVDTRQEQADATLFVLPVAPDRPTKGDVSGGPPYGVVLPDSCADGLFVGETTTSFVSYLNGVFATGGFPHAPTSVAGRWWRWRRELSVRPAVTGRRAEV